MFLPIPVISSMQANAVATKAAEAAKQAADAAAAAKLASEQANQTAKAMIARADIIAKAAPIATIAPEYDKPGWQKALPWVLGGAGVLVVAGIIIKRRRR